MKVIFHRLARRELGDAARYYDGECEGLGHEFLNEVQEAIGFIQENPKAAPKVEKDVRRRLLRRFPYGLMYALEERLIYIVAVANLRRRPFYWKGRKTGG